MSLLSRLFRRRPRKAEPAEAKPPPVQARPDPVETSLSPVAPPVEPPQVAPVEAAAPPPSEEPAAENPGLSMPAEPEVDEEDAEAEAGEATGPDPFIGAGEPLQISLPTGDGLVTARHDAEVLALSGPQRVTLADPAGPGSLAETLARLESEGRLTSEVVDDPEEGPFILYRPADGSDL